MWNGIKQLLFSNFSMVTDDICQCWSLEAGSGTSILQKPKQKLQYFNSQTHINYDQIYHIRNDWFGSIFFSPGDSHTKRLLVLLHPGLEVVTEFDSDPKWRFISFKVTTSNERVLCVYAPSRHNTREQLVRGAFLWRTKNLYEKNVNENKIILGDLNSTMDKMDRDGGNKRRKL